MSMASWRRAHPWAPEGGHDRLVDLGRGLRAGAADHRQDRHLVTNSTGSARVRHRPWRCGAPARENRNRLPPRMIDRRLVKAGEGGRPIGVTLHHRSLRPAGCGCLGGREWPVTSSARSRRPCTEQVGTVLREELGAPGFRGAKASGWFVNRGRTACVPTGVGWGLRPSSWAACARPPACIQDPAGRSCAWRR